MSPIEEVQDPRERVIRVISENISALQKGGKPEQMEEAAKQVRELRQLVLPKDTTP